MTAEMWEHSVLAHTIHLPGSRDQYHYYESCSGGTNIHGFALVCLFSGLVIEGEV